MSVSIRRFIALMCVMTLVVGTFAFGGGLAQAQQNDTDAPGIWASSINLQNISSSPASQVTIDFYSGNDGAVAESFSLSGAPLQALQQANGFASIYVPNGVSNLASGQYSAVVSSDVELQAIVNTGSTDTDPNRWTLFAYEGFGSADTSQTLYFSGLYKSFFGFESEVVIQNAGSTATTPTMKFYNNETGAQIGSDISLGTIQPNESRTYPMQDSLFSALPSGDTGIFGAIVEADQPIAGIANIWRPDSGTAGTASYSAFTSGATTLYVPSLTQKYYGFGSALTVQNIDSSTAAQVEVEYSNGVVQTATIEPNAARAFIQGDADDKQPGVGDLPDGEAGDAGSFSATVTSTNGVDIVALVSFSTTWDYSPAGTNYFASYSVPQEAASSLNVPIVMQNYYGYFSNVTIQNTSGTSSEVTLTYPTGDTWTQTIPGGESRNYIHLDNAGGVLPSTGGSDPGAPGTVTSAVVTSNPPVSLVAVIQQNTASTLTLYQPGKASGDWLSVFTGTTR